MNDTERRLWRRVNVALLLACTALGLAIGTFVALADDDGSVVSPTSLIIGSVRIVSDGEERGEEEAKEVPHRVPRPTHGATSSSPPPSLVAVADTTMMILHVSSSTADPFPTTTEKAPPPTTSEAPPPPSTTVSSSTVTEVTG